MLFLSKLLQVLAKSIIKTFPKVGVLMLSTKGAMDSSFARAPCT